MDDDWVNLRKNIHKIAIFGLCLLIIYDKRIVLHSSFRFHLIAYYVAFPKWDEMKLLVEKQRFHSNSKMLQFHINEMPCI